jgi:endoglucanase Acf2
MSRFYSTSSPSGSSGDRHHDHYHDRSASPLLVDQNIEIELCATHVQPPSQSSHYQQLSDVEDGRKLHRARSASDISPSKPVISKKLRRVSFSSDFSEDDYLLSSSKSSSPRSNSDSKRYFGIMLPVKEHPVALLDDEDNPTRSKRLVLLTYAGAISLMVGLYVVGVAILSSRIDDHVLQGPAPDPFSDATKPYSIVDPVSLGFLSADRPQETRPGPIFSNLVNDSWVPLPTNAWCQNLLLGTYSQIENQVFQVPYVVDTAGPIPVSSMLFVTEICRLRWKLISLM